LASFSRTIALARRSDFYPKTRIHKMTVQKMQVVVQKMQVEQLFGFVHYSSNRRASKRKEEVMKRCALCHGRLGLGVRFRNIWNGHWWVHVRFCSVRCEGIYEVRRNEAAKHRWHTFLAHSNSRS
jgi:hypothetical protein